LKRIALTFALILTVAFSGCVAAPGEGMDVWQEDCWNIGATIPLSCLDPPGKYVITKVEVWDSLVKYNAEVYPSDSYCNTLLTPKPWEFIVHVCPGFYWQGTLTNVRVTIRGPMDTGAETTYVLEDSFYQQGCPLTIVTGTGWDPQQPGVWSAKARYGQNNPTTGAYELEIGFGTMGNRDEKNHGWTSGQVEHFTLDYNGITHIATLTVTGAGDQSASYNVGPAPTDPCESITKIMIHAKSNTGGTCVIANLELNGVSIGSPNSITATGGTDPDRTHYLRITTDCYLTHFVLQGDLTFTWGTPIDERPTMHIFVEYS